MKRREREIDPLGKLKQLQAHSGSARLILLGVLLFAAQLHKEVNWLLSSPKSIAGA